MTKFTFQFLETRSYRVTVEAEDEDAGESQALALLSNETSDMYDWSGSEIQCELVINEDTGEERFTL